MTDRKKRTITPITRAEVKHDPEPIAVTEPEPELILEPEPVAEPEPVVPPPIPIRAYGAVMPLGGLVEGNKLEVGGKFFVVIGKKASQVMTQRIANDGSLVEQITMGVQSLVRRAA